MAWATGSRQVRRASMRATSTLLLGAQLVALGHLLVVRHTICPEHGEAIHSESPGEAQTLDSSHESTTAEPALGPTTPSAEHAHDHCLALTNTRERFAPLPAPDVMPGPLPAAADLPSLGPVGVAPAVAVLLLAPKNSPPWA